MALAQPAGAFDLAWPVNCTLGDTCHIQQYVDHDSGPGATDYLCGPLSYDGHDGTDIRLNDRAEMAAGVQVLAAAPGTVRGVRDGMVDFASKIPGKDCGNGVVITHADGWETQYCHMRQGSVLVKAGDTVVTGTPLGLIGQTGMADFPHVHLTVRKNGKVLDPFEPESTACALVPGPTLWQTPVPYEAGGFLTAGFSSTVPHYDAVVAGLPITPLPTSAPGLVLWGFAFGTRTGDEMDFQIMGPQGRVMQDSAVLEKNQAQMFRATGKKADGSGWPAGVYVGTITLTRAGQQLDVIETEVSVGP